jgi:hypothetical protein
LQEQQTIDTIILRFILRNVNSPGKLKMKPFSLAVHHTLMELLEDWLRPVLQQKYASPTVLRRW